MTQTEQAQGRLMGVIKYKKWTSPKRKHAVIDALCSVEETYAIENKVHYLWKAVKDIESGCTYKEIIEDLTL